MPSCTSLAAELWLPPGTSGGYAAASCSEGLAESEHPLTFAIDWSGPRGGGAGRGRPEETCCCVSAPGSYFDPFWPEQARATITTGSRRRMGREVSDRREWRSM
jgi:hypothetical protein